MTPVTDPKLQVLPGLRGFWEAAGNEAFHLKLDGTEEP